MIKPPLAKPATPLVPREETQTPVQYTTTITIAVHTPLEASSGLITYARVLATNPSSVG